MTDEQSLTHTYFERIKNQCAYYDPSGLNKNTIENQMSMIHINSRSMINKFDEIKFFLSSNKWSFIFVSETWFNNDLEELFSLSNYKLFSTSRVNKAGGGSAIYVREEMDVKQVHIFEFTTAEAVSLKVNIHKNKSCLIIQIYRPPRNNLEFLVELEQCLAEVTKLNILTYIVGDFNVDLFSSTEKSFNGSFFNLMCSFGFLPTISKATRACNGSGTLIDNIFCNDISVIHHSGVIKTDFSDHFSIFCSSNINLEKKSKTDEVRASFDYSHIDDLKQFIVEELKNFQLEINPEKACDILINAYSTGIDKFTKIKHLSRKNNAIQPWITQGLLKSINKKMFCFVKN